MPTMSLRRCLCFALDRKYIEIPGERVNGVSDARCKMLNSARKGVHMKRFGPQAAIAVCQTSAAARSVQKMEATKC